MYWKVIGRIDFCGWVSLPNTKPDWTTVKKRKGQRKTNGDFTHPTDVQHSAQQGETWPGPRRLLLYVVKNTGHRFRQMEEVDRILSEVKNTNTAMENESKQHVQRHRTASSLPSYTHTSHRREHKDFFVNQKAYYIIHKKRNILMSPVKNKMNGFQEVPACWRKCWKSGLGYIIKCTYLHYPWPVDAPPDPHQINQRDCEMKNHGTRNESYKKSCRSSDI